MSYIYVIGVQEEPIKVGKATDTEKRLSSLQVGCPDRLKLFYRHNVRSHLATAIERAVHADLSEFHRHGEWFNASWMRAKETIERIAPLAEITDAHVLNGSGKLLDRLRSQRDLPIDAVSIARWYRMASLNPLDGKAVADFEADIARRAGPVALNLYRMAFVEDKHPDLTLARDWKMAAKIRTELASAIHAASARALDKTLGKAA